MIGISVGEKNLNKAFKYRKLLLIIGFSMASFNALTIVIFKKQIASFYTDIEIL